MQNMPVAVGGVGGSGTRVVSKALGKLGYFIGYDLNEASDNLSYTLLFKRPDIFCVSDEDFCRALSIFTRAMAGGSVPETERNFVSNLAQAGRWNRHSAQWLQERVSRLPFGHEIEQSKPAWAWKEPNTHILLDRFWGALPKLKYVHVRRHGLDMAFSGNQNQPQFWGEYILGEPCPASVDPVYSLRYWCAAEQRVLRIVEHMGKSAQFHVLNFDRLCRSPETEFAALLAFLGIDSHPDILQALASLVSPPSSIGRYREQDLSVFSVEDLKFVESMGFTV